jgi:hypothetical protein
LTLKVRDTRTEPGWDGGDGDGEPEETLQERGRRVGRRAGWSPRRRRGENIPAASRIPNSTPLPLLRPRLRPRWLRMPVVRRGDTRRWAAAAIEIDRVAPARAARHLCCGVALLFCGAPHPPRPKPSQ